MNNSNPVQVSSQSQTTNTQIFGDGSMNQWVFSSNDSLTTGAFSSGDSNETMQFITTNASGVSVDHQRSTGNNWYNDGQGDSGQSTDKTKMVTVTEPDGSSSQIGTSVDSGVNVSGDVNSVFSYLTVFANMTSSDGSTQSASLSLNVSGSSPNGHPTLPDALLSSVLPSFMADLMGTVTSGGDQSGSAFISQATGHLSLSDSNSASYAGMYPTGGCEGGNHA